MRQQKEKVFYMTKKHGWIGLFLSALESDNERKTIFRRCTVLFWGLVAPGGYRKMLPRMQTGTSRPARPDGLRQWSTVVLPADFGVNLSLLAAHTARSRYPRSKS